MRSPTEYSRLLPWLCLLLAGILLTGCAPRQEAPDPHTAAQSIAATQPELTLTEVTPEDTRFAALLSRSYGIDPESVSGGSVLYTDGVSASEIVVLLLRDNEAAQDAASALSAYAEQRSASFAGYAPDEAKIAQEAQIFRDGSTVMLIMCPDPAAARQAAQALLSETAQPEVSAAGDAPGVSAATAVPDMPVSEEAQAGYDHDAVLDALVSGSPAGLRGDNLAVYEKADAVLSAIIQPGMTPYEQELAVHDWMTANIDYDPAELEHPLAGATPAPNHDNPAGALLNGNAICYGYSSTFQLFMDALGIPCITINGQANAPAEAHSWNAVELDGQWYYVDVTWDDPVNGAPDHRYLNQTTAFLEAHGPHIWDRTGLPEIAAEPYAA